jgi:hypothetical protein
VGTSARIAVAVLMPECFAMRTAVTFVSMLLVLLIDSPGIGDQGSGLPAQPLPLPARIALFFASLDWYPLGLGL